jgi:uncharacterized protein YjbI with pentapeptide repeats
MPKSLVSTEKPGLKLKDKTFAFVGKINQAFEDQIRAAVLSEGGKVAETVSSDVNVIVQGTRAGGAKAGAAEAAKLAKQGVLAQVVDDVAFFEFLIPDKQSLAGIFRSNDFERLNLLLSLKDYSAQFDLTQADFNAVELSFNADFPSARVNFAGSGFKNARISNGRFDLLENNNFSNAQLDKTVCRGAADCSFKGATMSEFLVHADMRQCDFSDSKQKLIRFYGVRIENCDFRKCAFEHGLMLQSYIEDCDFSSAEFNGILATGVNFVRCKFHNVSVKDSWFVDCKFEDCDLSGCDFGEANLALSTFIKTKSNKTNFTGCILDGANCAGLEAQSAIGLKQILETNAKKPDVPSCPSIVQFSEEVRACTKFECAIELENAAGSRVTVVLSTAPRWTGGVNMDIKGFERNGPREASRAIEENVNAFFSKTNSLPSVTAAFKFIAAVFSDHKPVLDCVTTKLTKGQVDSKEFLNLAVRACCESFGMETPSDKQIEKMAADKKKSMSKQKDDSFALLRGGAPGIAQYNASLKGKRRPPLKKVDLSGCDLSGVNFSHSDLSNANLENCNLSDCNLDSAVLNGANLKGAKLNNSSCIYLEAISANFANATMNGAKLMESNLQRAVFENVDFEDADLTGSYIFGTIMPGAKMLKANLTGCHYDHETVLPADDLSKSGLYWCGKGADPFKVREILESDPAEPLDFGKFLERLEKSIDKERLKKAIKMLKAESFQLFTEVKDNQMIGVVKSQTDADLVYSCVLTSEGKFCCGTQNLNPCGGLRGALCKHLLVLLLGLTNAGELDANVADKWARASTLQQPKMDKDVMSETFLRYKGAEAGDIDWRPTETIPEDYYAF